MRLQHQEALIEALSRGEPGARLDEALIRGLLGREVSAARLGALASASKLLRLMHGLLAEDETPESFVAKFSEQWLSAEGIWDADSSLDQIWDELNDFHSKIQLFSPSRKERAEEPLLFGSKKLNTLVAIVYPGLERQLRLALGALGGDATTRSIG